MENTIEKNTSEAVNTQEESSIEYKSGGFNRWGVNVETDSRSSRHSSIIMNDDSQADLETVKETLADLVETAPVREEAAPLPTDAPSQVDEDNNDEEGTSENFAYYVAKQMIKEGALPNYDDVDEDITFEDIYEGYKEAASEQITSEILNNVQNQLKSSGVTDENIVLLQAIENGVPLDELYEVNRYQKYSSLDESTDEGKKLEVIKEWYKSRNLSDKEIRRNLDAIEISDEIDSEFNDAKQFFAETLDKYHEVQKQYAAQEMQQRRAIQQMNEQILYKAINQGVLANEKLTSEQSRQLQRDIYEKNISYNIDGNNVYLSPFEEFLYKINNDFEFQLLNFKNFKWRGKEVELMKVQAKDEAERDYLEAFKKAQIKSASKGSIKRKNETVKDGMTVYTNETGGRTFEF